MTLGIDVAGLVNASAWACIAARVRQLDGDALGTLTAHSIRMRSQILVEPCQQAFPPTTLPIPMPTKDASQQASDMLKALGSNFSGKVWIDVEYNPSPGCSWSSISTGCVFLRETVATIQQQGVGVGVYSSHYDWNNTVGLDCQLQGEYDLSLWYAHYDGVATSCSDFTPFGGLDRTCDETVHRQAIYARALCMRCKHGHVSILLMLCGNIYKLHLF